MVLPADIGSSPLGRRPLGDASSRGNIGANTSSSKQQPVLSSPGPQLPHHESLAANGALTVLNATERSYRDRDSVQTSVSQDESKRDSQASTTSTNTSSRGRRRKTHIGPWQLGPDVGKGGCGKVRKVKHSTTGQIAAAKIISKKAAERARAESLMSLVEKTKNNPGPAATANVMPFGIEREIAIMKLLEHPNVVKLYDLWENRDEIYLIMEYVNGGELFDYVDKYQYLEDDETVFLFRQIVAALLHCHRIGIHHRDLKPENILLDKETMQVKLVDFGMAALQPHGKFLTTPCGSVHYAAPEVFEKNYDGNKVDVWSLGVLLYVMLTGTIPFDYKAEYVSNVLPYVRLLKSGRFYMPESLSVEAKDLIKRMLVPDPRARISLDEVWKHPFIHKYEAIWREPPGSGSLERWIGPAPVISNWTVKTQHDIDREIFRNLKTLWHSEKESVLIDKLLSPLPNQEKFFYYAIHRYQQEQLEDFAGDVDSVPISKSDHHHFRRSTDVDLVHLPPIPCSAYERTKSSFSIMSDTKTSKRNLRDHPPSVGSYDPFRASKKAIVPGKGTYRVTVHSGQTTKDFRSSHTGLESIRVEAVRRNQHSKSPVIPPSAVIQHRASAKPQDGAPYSTSSAGSRSFSTSAARNSFSKASVKARSAHKRGIEFSHLRRSSTAHDLERRAYRQGNSLASLSSAAIISEAARGPDPECERSGVDKAKTVRLGTASERHSQMQLNDCFATEARKVSNELEKFCEDVFNRPSPASVSGRIHELPNSFPMKTQPSLGAGDATPPEGFHDQNSMDCQRRTSRQSPETPTTYVSRELMLTRERIAARLAQEKHASQNSSYGDIIAQLDALLKPNQVTRSAKKVTERASSAPAWGVETASQLPMINEEGQGDTGQQYETKPGSRSVTAPMTTAASNTNHPPTLRMVVQESPLVEPLVIRKTGDRDTALPKPMHARPWSKYRYYAKEQRSLETPTGCDAPRSQGLGSLGQTSEPTKTAYKGDVKKRGWFQRRFSPGGERSMEDAHQTHCMLTGRDQDCAPSNSAATAATPSQPPSGLSGKRPGFLNFWGRRKAFRKRPSNMTINADDDESTSIGDSVRADSMSGTVRILRANSSEEGALDLGVQRSWLARIFHIKPASAVLCFHVGRGKARQEIVRLLKSWRMYGMKDVVLDREHNLVHGRLSNTNSLGIKEVAFVAELFVVLEHGRRAQLSMARFTQTSGAASSFRRVVDTLDEVLQGRGLMVSDSGRKREIEALLKDCA